MMERLTRRQLTINGEVICKRNNPFPLYNCNDSCVNGICRWNKKALRKLKEYEDLEEQGLLLRLPCKVGDTVYKPNPITLSEIVEIKIESIFITESKINTSGRTTKMKYSFCCSPSDFGKTVFLTQAEAEQKLKEMKDK